MISIFIRTYHNDIKWLNHCLKSIHQNLIGWDEIVICIPNGQEHLLRHLTQEKIVTCKLYKDDYLGQQVSKLHAHNYCNGDYILFVDSDVIFKSGADVRDYFYENKPVILKDNYTNVGDAICWKKPTENLFKENIDFEYMRRAPQLFLRSTLERFNTHFSDIENYITSQPHRQFSEFNVLGYYCDKMENENYSILEVGSVDLPENKCVQFWSWSGLTQKDLELINNILCTSPME
jgi:hypothetical protein